MDIYIVFVYNSNGGPLSEAVSLARKLVSPATFQDRLSALTKGVFGLRDEWRKFVRDLPIGTRFFHRDELWAHQGIDATLPAILIEMDGEVQPWITAEEINACRASEELLELIKTRFNQLILENRWTWLPRFETEEPDPPTEPLRPAGKPAGEPASD